MLSEGDIGDVGWTLEVGNNSSGWLGTCVGYKGRWGGHFFRDAQQQ